MEEATDLPAVPPIGWRTVANEAAGFTLAVPRRWSVRTRRAATLIRSRDRLLAISVAADRGPKGRELGAQRYAEETMRRLPGFRDVRIRRARTVRNTPYESGRLDATAVLRTRARRERVSVAVLHVRRRVSFALIAFRNARVPPRAHDSVLDRLLATFRAGEPTG